MRAEAVDGQARAGFNAADELLNLRTTLMAQYRDGPVRLVAELWDSRVYGDEHGTPVTTGEVNTLELVQAFAEVKAPGLAGEGSTATIAAGRFVMNLGSRRLVAADDHRNTTNGYTGVRADLAWRRGWSATLIYASGDKPGGRYGRFDTLFGMRRADLAPGRALQCILRSNIVSPGVRVESVPSKRTDLMASLRPMWLAAREDSSHPRAHGTPAAVRDGSLARSSTGGSGTSSAHGCGSN